MERSVELVLKNEEQAYLSPLFKEVSDHELTAPLGRAAVPARGSRVVYRGEHHRGTRGWAAGQLNIAPRLYLITIDKGL